MTDKFSPLRPHKLSKADIESVDWLMRLDEPDLDPNDPEGSRRRLINEFNEWVSASPLHRRSVLEAYIGGQIVGTDPAEPAAFVQPDPRAQQRAPSWNPDSDTVLDIPRRGILRLSAIASLVIAMVAVTVFAVELWPWVAAKTYTTGLGQRLTCALADGSTVELNTLSEVKVAFSGDQRLVKLVRGEAIFSVFHDPKRPFRVMSGAAEIRALGTKFDVYQRQGPTRIAVMQGLVQVGSAVNPLTLAVRQLDRTFSNDSNGVPAHSIELNSGEALEVNGVRLTKESHPNIERMVAWHEGVLIADRETVAEVAAELNLYNRRKITVVGVDAATRRVSGTFSTNDPQAFVEVVDESLNLPSRFVGDGWVIGE